MNRRGGRKTAPFSWHTWRVMNKRFRRTGLALAALAALVLAVGAGAGTARGPKLTLSWQAPTPADGSAFTVSAGAPVSVELAASTSEPQLVLIRARGLPDGASLVAAYGRPGLATLTWTPTEQQVGEHVLTLTAETHDLPHAYARPRSFLVYVLPSSPAARDVALGVDPAHRPCTHAAEHERQSDHAPAATHAGRNGEHRSCADRADQRPRRLLGACSPADPAQRLDGLGPANGTRRLQSDLDSSRDRSRPVHGHALPPRCRRFPDTRGGRQALLADSGGRVLRARAHHGLLGSHLRPDRLRDQRPLLGAHGLAGRGLHRDPRDESAGDPARACLTRLRSDAELRGPAPVSADAARNAGHDHLALVASRRPKPGLRCF